jgi:hypothetical protein
MSRTRYFTNQLGQRAPHGTRTSYLYGCRSCQPCRDANTRYHRELRRRKLRARHRLARLKAAAKKRR